MDALTDFLTRLLSDGGLLSSLGALGLAYLGGVLSSLTPCVYPMIPITVSVVGGTATAGERPKRRWRDIGVRSFIYISGMTFVYSFLGVIAGLTGKVFGTLTNTSSWYLGLGIFMSLSALVMMDVIPFDPMALWNRIQRMLRPKGAPAVHPIHSSHQHREMTWLGAFSLGASSGFIASPCTTPVLTAILAFIAKTQSVGLGLGLMFFFSLGLGTLLLVIATFTGALETLPKSGSWMIGVKKLSGFILLGVAGYLVFRAGQMKGSI